MSDIGAGIVFGIWIGFSICWFVKMIGDVKK